jgi:peptidoglycan/xylan/chitin deacetylase (PgdA/CDA1 family)
MKNSILLAIVFLSYEASRGQSFELQKEEASLNYNQGKSAITKKFRNAKAGNFGEATPGIMTKIVTSKKIVAFTFDACGGPTGSGFDSALITFLKKEKIAATLFVSGSWIEKNDSIFRQLCAEPLFEIENHGLAHRPCSITAQSRYGIAGTDSIPAVFEEIELNARQIEFYNKRKPKFYRPAAAAADEGCVSIARELKEKVITYEVLSGDAVPGVDTEVITENIVKKTKPGSIIIMHMNHPERNGFEALTQAVPKLRKQGYVFVRLEGQPLSGKK